MKEYTSNTWWFPWYLRMSRRFPVPSDSVISEFLSGLPSYDAQNFTRHSDNQGRSTRRPAVHLPTTESPPEQVIVAEKSNILLRYLHQKWEKEQPERKRELAEEDQPGVSSKRPRFDDSDESSSS